MACVSSRRRPAAALSLLVLLAAQPVAFGQSISGEPLLALVEPGRGISSSQPNDMAALPDAPLPEAQGLTITILEGEGALNNIRQRTAREPIVQVEDTNHKPVAGALVLFTINDGSSGAGAAVNGLTSLSVTTGADGKARLHGLKPNNVEGEFTITVAASAGALSAMVIIHQTNQLGAAAQSQNSLAARHNWFLRGTLIGGVAVGGVLVAVVATHNNPGATVTAGNPTVGAPALRHFTGR